MLKVYRGAHDSLRVMTVPRYVPDASGPTREDGVYSSALHIYPQPIVTDGDPLQIRTQMHYVIIHGELSSAENKHQRLWERYRARR